MTAPEKPGDRVGPVRRELDFLSYASAVLFHHLAPLRRRRPVSLTIAALAGQPRPGFMPSQHCEQQAPTKSARQPTSASPIDAANPERSTAAITAKLTPMNAACSGVPIKVDDPALERVGLAHPRIREAP